MKKLMALFFAILFTGIVSAGPQYERPECVDGYTYSLTLYTRGNLCLDIYESPNACNAYKAVYRGDCYIVHYDKEKGQYYIYWRLSTGGKEYFNM